MGNEELARADGSVAWCATVAACYSRIAGYLQPEIARRIFGGGRTVVAGTINPMGKAFTVDVAIESPAAGFTAAASCIALGPWATVSCTIATDRGEDRAAPRNSVW